MKAKRILYSALASVLLLTGCSGDNPASNPSEQSTSDDEVKIVPITDSYTLGDYVPRADDPTIPAEEIAGEFGQETDKQIPAVFLTTNDPAAISRDEYCPCTIQIDAGMTNGQYQSTAVLAGEIRGRGHSTWEWPKKPYKIKLEEKAPLLGMEEAKRWVLISNYADESLLRNTVAFEMARTLDSFRFVPHAIPVDLYMNGIYQGVYTLGEQLEVKSSRLAIDDSLESVNTGYLLEIGGADTKDDKEGWDYFNLPSGCGINIKIKSPDTDPDPNEEYNWTQEHFDYIYKYVCKADAAITTLTDYDDYIDVDSFIDWFILHELTYNLDSCFNRSCYITKPKLGRLEMGPVWDFDLAFGNLYMDNPRYNDFATVGGTDGNSYICVNWFNYLLTDEDFRARARARWDEVKDTLVQTGIDTIDRYKSIVTNSAEMNFQVWRTLGRANGYQPKLMEEKDTYESQITYLRAFIYARKRWLDDNL